jgi:dephospho-CoA kinase
MGRRRTTARYWIQQAIKRPGSLRRWLKKNEKRIERRYGESPFAKDGKIKVRVLRKLRRDKEFLKELSGARYRLIQRKINLAITLKKLNR